MLKLFTSALLIVSMFSILMISGQVDNDNSKTYTRECKVLSYDQPWQKVTYVDMDGSIRKGYISSDDRIIYSDKNVIVVSYTGLYPMIEPDKAVLYINESVMI